MHVPWFVVVAVISAVALSIWAGSALKNMLRLREKAREYLAARWDVELRDIRQESGTVFLWFRLREDTSRYVTPRSARMLDMAVPASHRHIERYLLLLTQGRYYVTFRLAWWPECRPVSERNGDRLVPFLWPVTRQKKER